MKCKNVPKSMPRFRKIRASAAWRYCLIIENRHYFFAISGTDKNGNKNSQQLQTLNDPKQNETKAVFVMGRSFLLILILLMVLYRHRLRCSMFTSELVFVYLLQNLVGWGRPKLYRLQNMCQLLGENMTFKNFIRHLMCVCAPAIWFKWRDSYNIAQ